MPVTNAPFDLAKCRPAKMLGTQAWWHVNTSTAELARRRGALVASLQRLHVVSTLLSLPIDLPVPAAALDPRARHILAGLSPRLVEHRDGQVIRRTTAPLRVQHVVTRTLTLRRGIDAASTFATYCARSVVLPRTAQCSALELAEADYYGIGVFVTGTTELECLLAPEDFPDLPETAASWAFSELLHAQLNH